MKIELTYRESREIFYALLESYSSHERGRIQAKKFFKGEELVEEIKKINEHEKKHYNLLKKFSEKNDHIPKYPEVDPKSYL